jgi:hypothetical protein
MAHQPAPLPPHVEAFNTKVAELLKTAKPHELVDILGHRSSLLRRAADDNQNQNQGSRRNME